jgi:hypothetical protein
MECGDLAQLSQALTWSVPFRSTPKAMSCKAGLSRRTPILASSLSPLYLRHHLSLAHYHDMEHSTGPMLTVMVMMPMV